MFIIILHYVHSESRKVHQAPLGSEVRGTMHGSSGPLCSSLAPPPALSSVTPSLFDRQTPTVHTGAAQQTTVTLHLFCAHVLNV